MKDTREHIVHTALTLFLRKSFKEVTMKDIVGETGLSKGAFYHYFSSKEQVFEEVIRVFFESMLVDNIDPLAHPSLRAFYEDYLKQVERQVKKAHVAMGDKEGEFSSNIYFLIFDALKLLPGFKQKLKEQQRKELKDWTKVVSLARERGEIRSSMTDEQVAKVFIYINDAIGINAIMEDKVGRMVKDIMPMYDAFYASIKA